MPNTIIMSHSTSRVAIGIYQKSQFFLQGNKASEVENNIIEIWHLNLTFVKFKQNGNSIFYRTESSSILHKQSNLRVLHPTKQ